MKFLSLQYFNFFNICFLYSKNNFYNTDFYCLVAFLNIMILDIIARITCSITFDNLIVRITFDWYLVNFPPNSALPSTQGKICN